MKSSLTLLIILLQLSCNTSDKKSAYEQQQFLLSELNIQMNAKVQQYDGNKIAELSIFKLGKDQSLLETSDATWSCTQTRTEMDAGSFDIEHTFQLTKGEALTTGVGVGFSFKGWDSKNYVIMPAAVYNGNRFEVKKYHYPPFFKEEDYALDMPITITDVPRLNKHKGASRVDLNTGDLTTPAIGIYFPAKRKGIWILTEQATALGNSVLTLEENGDRTIAEFTISAPCVREKRYSMTTLSASDETGKNWKAGDKVTIKCKVRVFDNINSPAELNKAFLDVRKSIGTTSHINRLPFSAAFKTMEDHQNRDLWDEEHGYYSLTGGEGWNMHWQLGWVGGCMTTHPLSTIGQSLSKERAFTNYNTIITQSQAESGFYYTCSNGTGWCSDCFSNPFPDNLMLLRKNADALYYFYKYCLAQKTMNPDWQMPNDWKTPLAKFADAFVSLWKRYGQFGQFIDMEAGEIKVGGTNSAAMAIGGLALAYEYEQRPELLQTAKEAARYYYKKFIAKGLSCGGPGEILQNNDSESSFATLESFMVLYEVTGEEEWLSYAEDAAALCATWIVSYDYAFPPSSLFGKLDMHTSGAFWASTQNKHAAPGICTLSGDALFKLYRYTGNSVYLNLIKDIAHGIIQYVSTEERPIGNQEPGWVNERVNTSDWEGRDKIGEIFRATTWAETAAMLTVAEIPGIYVNPSKDELFVFDHVDASLEGNQIKITNPTQFDARVSVFVDKDPSKPYAEGFVANCPKVEVKAGGNVTYEFK